MTIQTSFVLDDKVLNWIESEHVNAGFRTKSAFVRQVLCAASKQIRAIGYEEFMSKSAKMEQQRNGA